MIAQQKIDTNREQYYAAQVALFEIAHLMKKADLSAEFIARAVRTAMDYEGVADLFLLWKNEEDNTEKNHIIADIQALIDDCQRTEKVEYPYIKMTV